MRVPIPADPRNVTMNDFIPLAIWSVVDIPDWAEKLDSTIVVVRTMATASLRIDSPNTSMFRTGSTSSA